MQTTKPSRESLPPSGLTRSQVARQLGVGITTVHRMRLDGELSPERDDAGVWRYDPADVIRGIRAIARRGVTKRRSEGETAALAFQMFDQGGGLREVVMALHLTPEEVRSLYADYKTSLYAAPGSRGPDRLPPQT